VTSTVRERARSAAVMCGLGRGAAASDRDADQGDLCAATRMTRWWHRPVAELRALRARILQPVAQTSIKVLQTRRSRAIWVQEPQIWGSSGPSRCLCDRLTYALAGMFTRDSGAPPCSAKLRGSASWWIARKQSAGPASCRSGTASRPGSRCGGNISQQIAAARLTGVMGGSRATSLCGSSHG
jgi:hypothetical protein